MVSTGSCAAGEGLVGRCRCWAGWPVITSGPFPQPVAAAHNAIWSTAAAYANFSTAARYSSCGEFRLTAELHILTDRSMLASGDLDGASAPPCARTIMSADPVVQQQRSLPWPCTLPGGRGHADDQRPQAQRPPWCRLWNALVGRAVERPLAGPRRAVSRSISPRTTRPGHRPGSIRSRDHRQ